MIRPCIIVLAMAPLLANCASGSPPGAKGVRASEFDIRAVAKTDFDLVTDVHQSEAFAHLRVIMEKLYKRNPREWRKSDPAGHEGIVSRVFDTRHNWVFKELGDKRGAEAVHLAFREDFRGDRVLAFVGGLGHMILESYGNRYEHFALDEIDPQRLYNSARNIEIALWKLANDKNARGELFLLSNYLEEGGRSNLSFEREFGKLIAEQDTLAKIVAEKTNRGIARVVQNVATAVFLPIGALGIK
jgi:hypothetical protein